jgi:hypothetical protein
MSSTTGWSPFLSSSSRGDEDEDSYYLAREIGMLERAVRDKGELSLRQGRLSHPRRGVLRAARLSRKFSPCPSLGLSNRLREGA